MDTRTRLAALTLALALAAPAARAGGMLVANDGGADCPFAATHATVQAAVDAAAVSGVRRIRVCPGTYAEQVRIRDFRQLALEGEPGARLVPPLGNLGGALIEVSDSRSVSVSGFELNGAGRFGPGGAPAYGISFRDSSGTIEGNLVLGIRETPLGTNRAVAICAEDTLLTDRIPVRVEIRGNWIGGYGQYGIQVIGAASARIEGNALGGLGGGAVLAQTGILVAAVRAGLVQANEVALNHSGALDGNGIRLVGSSRARVSENSLSDNFRGIVVDGARNRITENDVSDSWMGIWVEAGDRNEVGLNRLDGDGSLSSIAVLVDSFARETRISCNLFLEFGYGVFDNSDGSTVRRDERCSTTGP